MGVFDLRGIIDLLEAHFRLRSEDFITYHLCREGHNKFEALISIILSQNTRDDLALLALNGLRSKLGVVTPDSVLGMSISDIEEALKVAGLFRRKARVIHSLAKIIEDLGGMERFTSLPAEDVRKTLLNIRGVGYKTVDVYMLMCVGEEVFPIDTHIRRVLSRLSITDRRDSYLKIQGKVHKLLPPNYYLKAHLLLIELGRKYCKARKPLCGSCPISERCPKQI